MESSAQVALLMHQTLEDREELFKIIKKRLVQSSSGVEIISDCNTPMTTLVGLQDVKQDFLEEMKKRRGFQRLLLFGAPGSGKSQLVRAAATELRANLICVNQVQILVEWADCLELYTKALREILSEKSSQKDTILFLKHVDLHCKRSSAEEGGYKDLAYFLRHVQWSWSQDGMKLAIVGSTSKPQSLQEDVIVAFNSRLYMPTLNRLERKELLWMEIPKIWKGPHNLSEDDVAKISEKCFSIIASEIPRVVSSACQVRNPGWSEHGDKGIESTLLEMRYHDFHPLTFEDFDNALMQRKFYCLDQDQFQEYQTFYEKYENGKLLSMADRENWVWKEDVPVGTSMALQRNQLEMMSQQNESWFWGLFSWI